jgi:hypothetical protein
MHVVASFETNSTIARMASGILRDLHWIHHRCCVCLKPCHPALDAQALPWTLTRRRHWVHKQQSLSAYQLRRWMGRRIGAILESQVLAHLHTCIYSLS